MLPHIDRVQFISRESCPLHKAVIGNTIDELRVIKSEHDPLTGRTFRILRCSRCGVWLTDPYPTQESVAFLYEEREADFFDLPRGSIVDWLKNLSAKRDIKQAHRRGGHPAIRNALDFGTGNGRFAYACRDLFRRCAVDAVDFHPDPPAALKEQPGIRYIPLEAFQQTSGCYDLIILRHVLEHLHDPAGFLASLARRLSPEGLLYIEVPNVASAQVRLFCSTANALSLPYHLFNFDLPSLRSLLESVGLDCQIFTKTLPMAGCLLAVLLKQKRGIAHQLLGILLHPVQMTMDLIYGKFVLAAVCRRRRF